ncbi:MAG: DUF4445 domain-containing protein [Caldilineales bacterium]|nr:DUF4445 domain-containing protein [Caldilineales bacterium]
MTEHYQVEFEPLGRRGLAPADYSILESARLFGIDLTGDCGGVGVCGSCQIRVLAGTVSPVSDSDETFIYPEDIEAGYRLACMTYPESDCKIGIPPESLSTPMRTQVEGDDAAFALDPPVLSLDLDVPQPSLSHPLADADSVMALAAEQHGGGLHIDLETLRPLSHDLRRWDWRCRVSLHSQFDEIVAIRPAGSRDVGLAIDLGSTGIAGYVADLQSGEVLAKQGLMNPQINFGEDIISRINYAMKSPEAERTLRRAVVDGLNQLTADLCRKAGVDHMDILDAVIVGNTAMHHLLLGLPLPQLALAPFVPAISKALDVKARDVGLKLAAGAYVHFPPNIAGFVGSDHIAMLLATNERWQGKTAIALDIGTNTEISLTTADGEITCVSCASGPAFEGYQIKDGTRAKAGAIERVRISADRVEFETIEQAPPLGICGSGIVDAIAQMQLAGVVAESGRIGEHVHPNVRIMYGEREFLLAEKNGERRAITVTQDDVREIQLAKSSIQTGIQLLLADKGVDLHEVEVFIIAGAFGSYIDVPNSLAIGMFPSLPLDRFVQVGNAAGVGARRALLSASRRAEAKELLARIEYMELARHPRFNRLFARNCRLNPYRN